MGLKRYGLVLASLLIITFLIIMVPVSATYYTINPGPAAIQTAITNAQADDTIILNPGTYDEHNIAVSNNINLQTNTSRGGNPANTVIDAQNLDRIFNVTGPYSLTIDNLTLRNGRAAAGGPAGTIINGGHGGNGGAISSEGPVTVTSSTITGCSAGAGSNGNPGDIGGNGSAGGNGGAIYSVGPVIVASSMITSCSAGAGGNGGPGEIGGGNGGYGGNGGAIYALSTVTVKSSEINSCVAGSGGDYGSGGIADEDGLGGAGGNGGAIYSASGVAVTTTIITDCSAGAGGPGRTEGVADEEGHGGNGGAIYTAGKVAVTTTTITDCSAGSGGASDIMGGRGGNKGNGGAMYCGGGIFRFNRVYNNNMASNTIYAASGSLDATDNWWGTNNNPSLYFMGNLGTYSFDPWLVLGATAIPFSISPGQTSAIQANLTYNSTGFDTSGLGHVPDGTPFTFMLAGGTGSIVPLTEGTVNGACTTTFTPETSEGTATVNVTVDGQEVSAVVVSVPVTVVPTFTSITPAPSITPTVTLPIPSTTTRAGLDTVPVLGALVLCGIIFLSRNNGK